MTTVGDVLEGKGIELYMARHDATVLEVVRMMVELRVGSMVVTRDGEVAGLITERDCLKEVMFRGRPPEATVAADVMCTTPVRVAPWRSLKDCMSIMTEQRCRHVLVVDEQGLRGLVSAGDIMKRLSRDQEQQVEHLTMYIRQPYPG